MVRNIYLVVNAIDFATRYGHVQSVRAPSDSKVLTHFSDLVGQMGDKREGVGSVKVFKESAQRCCSAPC